MPVVEQWQPEGAIVLKNASTNEDMKRLAAEMTPEVRLMAGCAGLAHYLPDKLQIPVGKLPEVTLHQPLLVISGSTSKVSLDQLRYCEEKGFHSILLTDILKPEPNFKTLVQQVLKTHYSGVLLEVIRSEEECALLNQKAICAGLTSIQTSERIASNLDTVDKSVVLWYNEEKRTGVFLHGEQLSTARYVRCDVGNSQAVHNRKQGNVGRERKGYPSISEWRVLDFENGSTLERPAAGIW